MTIFGCIIPHAGFQYAGDCRKSVFKHFMNKNIEIIIYISALHSINQQDKNVYILENSNKNIFSNFFYNRGINRSKKKTNLSFKTHLPENIKKEHSYKWVRDELIKNFINSSILALCPSDSVDITLLNKKIYTFCNNVSKNILILSTTDLIHYGQRYDNKLKLNYPVLLDKVYKEQQLLNYLKNVSVYNLNRRNNYKNLMCGYTSIKIFINLAKMFQWKGEIVDYYDSYSLTSKNKYWTDFSFIKEKHNFVSYVGIVYPKTIVSYNKFNLTELDIKMALGILRTIITAKLLNLNLTVRLPIWNNLYKLKNGIFVGTSLNGSTNCSYGNYQLNLNIDNTANKLVKASQKCFNDAKNRWKLEYKNVKLPYYRYKIEILQDKSLWKKYYSKDIINSNILPNPNLGVFLKLSELKQATYLPIVAKENPNWTLDEYMGKLSKKAGGTYNSWKNKNIIIKTYESDTFFS